MSLHYLLDGYNLIHQVPALAHGSLEERREALVRWVNVGRPQGSARNRVTIVFDGSKDHFGSMAGGEVKVIFSNGESADACIKTMVERSSNVKEMVIVSDDKDIKLYARALGTRVLSVREFAKDLYKSAKASRGKSGPDMGQKVSLTKAHQINKELEKMWLKDEQ